MRNNYIVMAQKNGWLTLFCYGSTKHRKFMIYQTQSIIKHEFLFYISIIVTLFCCSAHLLLLYISLFMLLFDEQRAVFQKWVQIHKTVAVQFLWANFIILSTAWNLVPLWKSMTEFSCRCAGERMIVKTLSQMIHLHNVLYLIMSQRHNNTAWRNNPNFPIRRWKSHLWLWSTE